MLQVLEEEQVKEQLAARNIPDFGPGAVLEVKLVSNPCGVRVSLSSNRCQSYLPQPSTPCC